MPKDTPRKHTPFQSSGSIPDGTVYIKIFLTVLILIFKLIIMIL